MNQMKKLGLAIGLVLLVPSGAWAACSSPIAMADANSVTVNMDASAGSGANCAPQQQLVQGGALVAATNGLFVQPGTSTTWAATQSGTWTVQPGNTANSTAWLVTGTGGTFPATQSGGWTVTANAGTNLNTSALALDATLGTTNTDLGPPGATACATDTGSCSLNALMQRLATRLTTINTTLGSPFQAGAALAANQSVNTAQVNGVTTLTGTGATGTGSQRMTVAGDTATIAGSAPGTAGSASANVVTVQGVASMTKLLVTPDANSAVNVAQINGVTPLMGNGNTGTGSQRVTISADNSGIPAAGQSATGAAVPAGATYAGMSASGNLVGIVGCDAHKFVHVTSATDTLLVQGVTAKTVKVCGVLARFSGSAAQTVFLENTASTNANCSSTLTQITGAWVGNATTPSGAGFNSSFWNGLANTSGNGLCLNSTGTGGVDVDVFYTQGS